MDTTEFRGQTCGIYPRVSTKKQAKKDKSSLDDQLEACEEYADDLRMVVDKACIKTDAYTSRKRNRPGFNELLAQMKARRVPNLVIDRVDRMTRAGQLAAADFLKEFIQAGITLHVISMADEPLVVRPRDDAAYKAFLDAAYEAQQDNRKRVRVVKRAKRSRARAGHYIRGNHAPFGFQYVPCERDDVGNVTDWRMVPDERTYLSLGWPTTFAPTPYAARQEVVRQYADGVSLRQIADGLTRAGVPTANQLLKRPGGDGIWWPGTVREIVRSPLNEGILTNFRHEYLTADPDERHDEDWTQAKALPRDRHIVVTPDHGSPTPLVDAATLARVAARSDGVSFRTSPYRSTVYLGRALLAGGLAVCGLPRLDTGEVCGGTLRVRSVRRRGKAYLYYGCHRHEEAPSVCRGLSLPVGLLDPGAWNSVLNALTELDEDNDNYLDKLAAQQADADSSATPGGRIADLRETRDRFQQDVDTLVLELVRAQSQLARDGIQRQIDRLEPEIADANRKIAAYERQSARVAERRELLADTLYQYGRHLSVIGHLDPENPDHIPAMATVLRAVGAKLTVGKTLGGAPDVSVELTITPAAAAPWFTPETEVLVLAGHQSGVVGSGQASVTDWPTSLGHPADSNHRPFAAGTCSPR